MSMELVRRTKVLRLCKEILGNEARAEDLEQLVSALEEQSSHIEGLLKQEVGLKMALHPEQNVIPFQKQKKPVSLKSSFKVFDKRFVINSPCLVEGSTPFERKKLAFEIHSRSSKTVFMDLEGIHDFWESGPLGLEDSTLFVPEVSTLDPKAQEVLLKSLTNPQGPLIIAATKTSFSELKSQTRFSDVLLHKLSQAHFRLQRPLKEYMEMGFFKLFLESLA